MGIVDEAQKVTTDVLPRVSTVIREDGLIALIGDRRQLTARTMPDIPMEQERQLTACFQGGVYDARALSEVPITLGALLPLMQASASAPDGQDLEPGRLVPW